MSQLLEYTQKSRKKSTNYFWARKNFLKGIMSQLLDNTKKMTKIEGKKSRKIIFGSELSEANNEPTLRWHQKIDKKSRRKKIEKLFLTQNCLKRKMSQLLEYTKKIDKKSRKKIEKLFFGQNFLKQIMSQLLDNTKK